MMVSHPRLPLLLPCLSRNAPWGCPQPERKPERAPPRYFPHRKMTGRRRYGTPDVRRQHCRGAVPLVSQDVRAPVASLSNNAAQNAAVTSPRAPTPSVANSHGAVPAKGTSVASAVHLSQGTISTKGTRASCAVPLGHGPRSAKGTQAHSAVPLCRGINSSTGIRV